MEAKVRRTFHLKIFQNIEIYQLLPDRMSKEF